MKAIAIVGSPRKNGNTTILTQHTLRAIAEEGIETELISLAGMDIRPCQACMFCRQPGNEDRCAQKDDLQPIYDRMKQADSIILASPVYFGSATSLIKALIERTGYMGGIRRDFNGKVGGPLVVARRAGQNFTIAQLMYWFQICGLFTPGSTYWNIAFGREIGDVSKDEEGMRTAWNFGKNIAFLLRKTR